MLDIAGLVPTTAATVTERWDPAARHRKPTNRLDWWKGKFVLFQMLATGGRTTDVCPKADALRWQPLGKSLYKQKEEVPGRNSTISSDSHLQVWLVVV